MASNIWTQKQITDWAVKTFGMPDNPFGLIDRAVKEMDELLEEIGQGFYFESEVDPIDSIDGNKVLEEIADVVIVLSQVVQHLGGDLQDEIAKKMIKNVKCEWVNTGVGVGKHV